MADILIKHHQGFVCGSSSAAAPLLQNESLFTQLLTVLQAPMRQPASDLGGRRGHAEVVFEGVGAVVIKPYGRGGVLGRVVRRSYLRHGSTRPENEFRMLEKVRELGVFAPEPLAWVTYGGRWYSGWLLTRCILEARTLAEISLQNEELAAEALRRLESQLAILIRAKIFHVDLHPGNVLVREDGSVYLIDFDKAHLFKRGMDNLRDRYLCRWRRAVIKHRLPEILAEQMSVGLRKSFERECA